MTLQQVIDLAKKTELKNAAAVREDAEAVLGYINLGLMELYKRFPLSTEEVVITIGQDGTAEQPYTMVTSTMYKMPSDYMYIISAYGEVSEDSLATVNTLPVNEEDNPHSVNTPSWNMIQIPALLEGEYVSIVYAAAPIYYTEEELGEILPIPVQLLDALMAYIGWKGYSSIDPARAENAAYFQKFEAACDTALKYGVIASDDMYMNTRVSERGFV